MTGTPTTYTGEDAQVWIKANGTGMDHSVLAISDFSITIDRGTNEQSLVGESGNYFLAGSRTITGSLTSCRLHTSALGNIIADMIAGGVVQISGSAGPNSLHFYFKSCQITGFDLSIGDADTITEGSIDFTVLYPYKVSSVTKTSTGTLITDF